MDKKELKEDYRVRTGETEFNFLLKGGYVESVWKDVLTEEEMELFLGINENERLNALEELGLLTIREKRMLKRIKNLQEHDFTVTEIEKEIGISEKGAINKTKTKQTATLGQIQAIEEALTRVQSAKLNVIRALQEINTNINGSIDVNVYVNALNSTAEEVWDDEEDETTESETE